MELIREGTQTRLKFEKSYADYNFLSIEISSKKSRSFDLVTFYVTKNNKKREGRIQNLANTSNMGELASQAVPSSSGLNISQKIGIVNMDDEKSSAQSQPRTKTLSDHEVLEMAADEVLIKDFTDAEKDAFDIFKKRLVRLRQIKG